MKKTTIFAAVLALSISPAFAHASGEPSQPSTPSTPTAGTVNNGGAGVSHEVASAAPDLMQPQYTDPIVRARLGLPPLKN